MPDANRPIISQDAAHEMLKIARELLSDCDKGVYPDDSEEAALQAERKFRPLIAKIDGGE